MSDAQCEWSEMRKDGPNGETVQVPVVGTRAKLLKGIQKAGEEYNHHRWIHRWTKHQLHLDAPGSHGGQRDCCMDGLCGRLPDEAEGKHELFLPPDVFTVGLHRCAKEP